MPPGGAGDRQELGKELTLMPEHDEQYDDDEPKCERCGLPDDPTPRPRMSHLTFAHWQATGHDFVRATTSTPRNDEERERESNA